MNLSTVSQKETQIFLTISKVLFLIASIFSCIEVNAGEGCCSHYKGVDNTKCTTDGRQICKQYVGGKPVISNGDSCTCNPNDYNDNNLINPDGNYETHPYDYYQNYSNNSSANKINEEESNANQCWTISEIIVFIIVMTPVGLTIIAVIYTWLESLCKSFISIIKK